MAMELYQHFSFQGPPKFTQIGIFGFKLKFGNPVPYAKAYL
jgi:hypothetical protein